MGGDPAASLGGYFYLGVWICFAAGEKHLGDYYVLGALLFSLPYVYTIWLTKCGGYVRVALQVMYGAFSFFMLLFPLIYISYYWRRGIYESDHNRSTLL